MKVAVLLGGNWFALLPLLVDVLDIHTCHILGPKLTQAPNGTNIGLFMITFQYISAVNRILKVPHLFRSMPI